MLFLVFNFPSIIYFFYFQDPSIHLVNNQCFISAHEFDLAVKPNDLAKDLIQRIHEETGLTGNSIYILYLHKLYFCLTSDFFLMNSVLAITSRKQ